MKNVLANLSKTPLYSFILANEKGNTLVHHDDSLSWGFYKDKKYFIKEDFPKNYKEIVSKSLIENPTFVSKRLDISTPDKLILILQIKESYLKEQELGKFYEYALISLIVFVIAMIMSFIFSKYVQELLDNLSNTRKSNRELKSKVREKNRELLKSNEELQHLNENLEQKIEEEIAKNKEKEVQLFAQAKLAAMGDMIGNIAHQWRQPLAVISMQVNNILFDIELKNFNTSVATQNLYELQEQVSYLSKTMDDFGLMHNTSNTANTRVNINEPILKAISLLEKTFVNNKIRIVHELHSNSELSILEGEMLQVILNILNNARYILISRKIDNPLVYIKTNDSKDKTTIIIGNNGGGIESKHIDKIFDAYYTTKEEKNNSGLGLYMCKIIIEKNFGGTIWFDNTENGVEFTINLPV